jgi:hypothetical protein
MCCRGRLLPSGIKIVSEQGNYFHFRTTGVWANVALLQKDVKCLVIRPGHKRTFGGQSRVEPIFPFL